MIQFVNYRVVAIRINGRCEPNDTFMLKLPINLLANNDIEIRYRIVVILNLHEKVFFVFLTIDFIFSVTNSLPTIFFKPSVF